MTPRTARVLAWSLCAVVFALIGAEIVLLIAGWPLPTPQGAFGSRGVTGLIAVTFATAGALIATRQPANPIGWLMLGAGICSAIQELAQTYAVFAFQSSPNSSTGEIGAWIAAWIWVVSITLAANAFLRFPDGRLPSPRWRAAPWFSIASGALLALDLALVEGPLESYRAVVNPFGIAGSKDVLDTVGYLAYVLFAASMLLGATAVVVRFRRSHGDERQQLKWIAFSGSVSAAVLISSLVAQALIGVNANEIPTWFENLTLLGFLTIPLAIAIAVLRYRLYDIDLVINKTVVYGALAVFITLVYVAIVVGAGAAIGTQSNAVLSAVAAAIVAIAFQPARRWAQRLANRLVYGERATPYEVLSGFSERLGDAYSVDDVLPRMARVLAEGIGAQRVAVWLGGGGSYVRSASWPTTRDEPVTRERSSLPGQAFDVRHLGEVLGAITVEMPEREPLAGTGEHLVANVASQAGLVLRNVSLVADLKASRQRLVAAQDEERRKIERNIHDGAQQRLVALSVKQRLAGSLVGRDDDKLRSILDELQADTGETLQELRDLARGIYPPLLADQGLASAIEAQARRAAIPVAVAADKTGRHPQDVESAVYFSVLEALQNTSKYAEASRATVTLEESDGLLRFEVSDDGRGFDPRTVERGSGLRGMADRVEAIDGELEIRSSSGHGTRITGTIPIHGSAVEVSPT